ncbi:CTP synthase (glutamine hydrolyzing) [Candidatus Woesearchaeota archaeon]|nr:CTP synthase (glutamine hydrolyzing) [Candidatus Woesearchaeota archaeon]
MPDVKYVVVTGGVVSGLGKGCATAALGALIARNKKVVTIKCDGYLNVDPGTINPYEHGEVYVLEDGGEVDMDFGHYERFLNINCKFSWNITSGKIFNSLITKERKGEFLGKTIQIFPHVIDEVKQWWKRIVQEEQPDFCFIEIGGTVGDCENFWFVEAARQLRSDVGNNNIFYAHLTYVPFLPSVGEPKTKPAQRDVALLREKGIIPDVLLCRSTTPLEDKIKSKLALFCNLESRQVVSVPDVKTIYELPLVLKRDGVLAIVQEKLAISAGDLTRWEKLVTTILNPHDRVTIALCGKYTDLRDSYASVVEALVHAGAHLNCGIDVTLVETTSVAAEQFADLHAHGILVPGGFGSRGVEGKITIIQHAREKRIPYLGICLGLQLAVIEFARNVCGLAGANTTEIDQNTPHPVVTFLPGQTEHTAKGGTMRLGACTSQLVQESLVAHLYQKETAVERHRHRYEVNPAYHRQFTTHGMVLSGLTPEKQLVEFIELPNHPYFVATQAHNEFTSRLEQPNPLFLGFVQAALAYKKAGRIL